MGAHNGHETMALFNVLTQNYLLAEGDRAFHKTNYETSNFKI